MSILDQALGADAPSSALARKNIVHDIIDQQKVSHAELGREVKHLRKVLEDTENAAILSAASKEDVRQAKANLDEAERDHAAAKRVIKALEDEMPDLIAAAEQEVEAAAKRKADAEKAMETISADVDAALQAQADYEAAVAAAQEARDKVIDELAQVTPEAARMVRGGADADAIKERAQQELEAAAEGLSITEYDLRNGALRTDAAKRNDALQEIDLDGPSVFMMKSEPIEQTAESLQVPQQTRWDPELKQMVAI
ncbi:hypothetical protein [Roseibium alexandrii]|uniref:Uncharacterized protein n=1 Tax=Roseibium alexandrii (strain DSM 17067 / NCIMB 14079 / DFL-11) TaxID=244592 RepID=A0A5E8H6I4_ROSAD|nr:hypothetical protein [Roseibium alexandrii]EEE47600.2 hypothetical protein SADFL11_4889 [Roseibium alexandrii DFL-11]